MIKKAVRDFVESRFENFGNGHLNIKKVYVIQKLEK